MTHEYRATVEWKRQGVAFFDNKYSRGHVWCFDGGVEVVASSAPASVPLPYSVAAAVDPEEALVAATSNCHMLLFLGFAAKQGFVIDRYLDEAIGSMSRNDHDKLYVSDHAVADRSAASCDRSGACSLFAGLAAHPARHRSPISLGALRLRHARLSTLRMEVRFAQRRLAAGRAALWICLRGHFPPAMIAKNRNRDDAWFSMLDSEWPTRKRNFERWLSPDNFDAQGIQKMSLAALNGAAGG